MKKIKILFWILIALVSFSSCTEDEKTTINSAALDGTLTFKLNEPSYSNYVYVLENANASSDMDSLTCQQPDYGFTAAVTYTTQVSMTSNFATYKSLTSTVSGEKVHVNTKEMNKALIAMNGGAFTNPLPTLKVYVRLKAFISDATTNTLDNDTTVKAAYSNVISINVRPYIEPLYPYYEVTVRPWYIVGLDGIWNNSTAGLGSSLIPLSVVSGNMYDATSGDGTFEYTGYFDSSKGFKLIRDVGAWNPQWGETSGEYTYNTGDNIFVPSSGYYTLTLNSIDNTLTIVAATAPATTYSSMGLIGEFNGWGGDVSLTANSSAANHIWYTTYTFDSDYTTDGGCKFRANGGWTVNWGAAQFPVGVGSQDGKNIPFKKGTYSVILNDVDGCFYFIAH